MFLSSWRYQGIPVRIRVRGLYRAVAEWEMRYAEDVVTCGFNSHLPYTKMAYEKYQTIKTKNKFFEGWEGTELAALTEKLKDHIYNKYVIKCKVYQRDNFTCQNQNCKYCHNESYWMKLTVHHIRFKKNNGADKLRNMVTVCLGSHHAYHKGKSILAFPDSLNLPAHIRGHLFKLPEPPNSIDWKKIKSDMKVLRKDLKYAGKLRSMPWFEIEALLKWLFAPIDEED